MVEEHVPYDKRRGHPCDFKVRYRIYGESEGGLRSLPFQGIRWDFRYQDVDPDPRNQLFAIHPEFEDGQGDIIRSGLVPKEGVARMWVLIPERRDYHCGRIQFGVKGYFCEGPLNTGECEVIEIVGLPTNPRSSSPSLKN